MYNATKDKIEIELSQNESIVILPYESRDFSSDEINTDKVKGLIIKGVLI